MLDKLTEDVNSLTLDQLCNGRASAVVVLDNGSKYIRAGLAGHECPTAVLQTLRPPVQGKEHCQSKSINNNQACEAYPIKYGFIRDWDTMNSLWDSVFNESLNLDASTSKLLISEPNSNTEASRLKMLEHMFEGFSFSSVSLHPQAALTLYSEGLQSGVVVESGELCTQTASIVDGMMFPSASKFMHVGGQHLSEYLLQLLQLGGHTLNSASDVDLVCKIKESICFITTNFKRDMKLAQETTYLMHSYTLPDGQRIRLGEERFLVAEAVLDPALIHKEDCGLADLIYDSIKEVDVENRRKLLASIVLSGGNSMFKNLPSRLEEELESKFSSHNCKGLKVLASNNRQNSIFRGGSVIADVMLDQPHFWISKSEYEECPRRSLKKLVTG
ncbi:hypothetical protein CEUSTIGMA_g1646.t1 [Chlamydomonas eustigma]|uniref:Uncharacterized protein n=1 Tax=Chlamydomonas eustigma TaxID=1157962 RepID=A0A250WTP6_9CHLO|nr:hypothetical protein CEUSTIGMA_g1646.t1 [Chlamydomonas eustigma]|eukprot:GAX74197.1 hypothetical protein CEUSTIGMA_g1646.t1 [Chlamydomonas eustigma]